MVFGRALLDAELPVRGVLCVVDADWPLIGGDFTSRGVQAVWPQKLCSHLQAEGPLTPDVIAEIHRDRARSLPLLTPTGIPPRGGFALWDCAAMLGVTAGNGNRRRSTDAATVPARSSEVQDGPVGIDDVVRLAEILPEVRCTVSDGRAVCRYHGRLVVRQLDAAHVVIRADFEHRDLLLGQFPQTFSVPARYAKHMMVVADLGRGDAGAVEDALEAAWRLQRAAD